MSQPPKRPRNDVGVSVTTINDLCDDVLREIFRYLGASELHAIANVSRAFNRNAQAELSSRYKVVDFDDDPSYFNPAKNQFNLQQLAPFLQRFGSSVVSIGVDNGDILAESSHLMDPLIEYCGKSLKTLQLGHICFTSEMVLKLRPILLRLEVLKLSHCDWELEPLPTKMLSFCSELQEIDIRHNEDVPTTRIIQSIVAHNPQVEKISLYGNGGEESDFVEGAKQLKRLTAVKSLYIGGCDALFTPVLIELAAASVPLEELQLEDFSSNAEFVKEISKWKQLKKLRLADGYGLSMADVLTIVRNLIELTELRLCLNAVSVNDLVEIVRCAPKLRNLEWEMPDISFLMSRVFDVDLFVQIRDVLANRKEKSSALLLLLGLCQLTVADELRKANEDFLKIDHTQIFEIVHDC